MWRPLLGCGFTMVALLVAVSTARGWVAEAASAVAPSEANDADPVDVALDPGHSSWDVGATGAGLAEYQLTLDMTRRVQSRLEASGYSVRLTRTDNARVAPIVPRDPIEATRVEQEARIAAAGPASVFVSIHFNAHPNSSLRGTETYFNGENRRAESVVLGTLIHSELLGALREIGYPVVDRALKEDLTAGKPYGHFFSLRGPFPSVLVESLFLSNAAEADALHQDHVLEAIADGIARGISGYLTAAGTPSQEAEV